MIHKFKHLVYRRIREYGGLSREDVAKAIGKNRQVVWRWEEEGQMPSRERGAAALCHRLAALDIGENKA